MKPIVFDQRRGSYEDLRPRAEVPKPIAMQSNSIMNSVLSARNSQDRGIQFKQPVLRNKGERNNSS